MSKIGDRVRIIDRQDSRYEQTGRVVRIEREGSYWDGRWWTLVGLHIDGGPRIVYWVRADRVRKVWVPARLRNAWRNIVIHPLAGVCWLFGLTAAGDWLHGD